MSERKPPYGSRIINRSTLPKAPMPPEEPLRGIEPGKIACQKCGKTFKTKSAFDRHKEQAHGTPERIL